MPALTFLAVVGLALVTLFFLADATLASVSPIVTSQQSGLPRSRQADAIHNLTTAPAPAVLAAQPTLEALTKIHGAAVARAEAPPNRRQLFRHKQQNQFDRFSIKGY